MASGDSLLQWSAHSGFPPSTKAAQVSTRNQTPILAFDASDATGESWIFYGILPQHYGGSGLTLVLAWTSASATSNTCDWEGSIERHQDDVDTIASDSFATAQAVTATAPSVAGEVVYDSITFTSGAQMDSLAAGEGFRLKIKRDSNDATNDTMTGDAQLIGVELQET